MLHGQIEVNEVPIGEWQAVRKEKVFTGAYRYDCIVTYRNLEGYQKTANFRVVHYEKLGALVLASMVLRTAVSKMR